MPHLWFHTALVASESVRVKVAVTSPSEVCRHITQTSVNYSVITKHSSALYIGIAKVLPIIDVLGYDGQNSSFSPPPPPPPPPYSDSTPITQKGSHIST